MTSYFAENDLNCFILIFQRQFFPINKQIFAIITHFNKHQFKLLKLLQGDNLLKYLHLQYFYKPQNVFKNQIRVQDVNTSWPNIVKLVEFIGQLNI